MLRYYGDQLALELGDRAKSYIPLYHKKGETTCKVAFMDLRDGKKKYVKFEWLNEQWMFVDLVQA